MTMHNPAHPGEVLNEACIKPLNISVTATAKALGISRKTLSAIIHGRARVTTDIAIRLGIAFDTSAESWIGMQTAYDVWNAKQSDKPMNVMRLVA